MGKGKTRGEDRSSILGFETAIKRHRGKELDDGQIRTAGLSAVNASSARSPDLSQKHTFS